MHAEKVRRKPRRRAKRIQPQRSDGDILASLARLGIGACSLGAEQLRKRLVASGAVPRRPARRDQEDAGAELGYLAAGIAVDSVKTLSRWVAFASERGLALVDAAGHLPGVHIATVIAGPPMRRYRAWASSERRHGRTETERGRRMVGVLVRDTTKRSFQTIADTAVKEVAHSPEIAALVRSESRGMATGAILEVRSNSEEADDRVEQRIRSWLRIHRSDSASNPPRAEDRLERGGPSV